MISCFKMIWAKLKGTVDNLKYFLLQFKSFSSRNSNLQTYALYWISKLYLGYLSPWWATKFWSKLMQWTGAINIADPYNDISLHGLGLEQNCTKTDLILSVLIPVACPIKRRKLLSVFNKITEIRFVSSTSSLRNITSCLTWNLPACRTSF